MNRPSAPQRQKARALFRFGKSIRMKAEVEVTPAGLVGIAVLVGTVLLSTSALLTALQRERG